MESIWKTELWSGVIGKRTGAMRFPFSANTNRSRIDVEACPMRGTKLVRLDMLLLRLAEARFRSTAVRMSDFVKRRLDEAERNPHKNSASDQHIAHITRASSSS